MVQRRVKLSKPFDWGGLQFCAIYKFRSSMPVPIKWLAPFFRSHFIHDKVCQELGPQACILNHMLNHKL